MRQFETPLGVRGVYVAQWRYAGFILVNSE